MRMTEKGQVTIPKPIRDRLGIGPGSEVDFVDRGEFVEVVSRQAAGGEAGRWSRFESQIEAMRGTIDTKGMDGKDFVDWLRGPRDDVFDAD